MPRRGGAPLRSSWLESTFAAWRTDAETFKMLESFSCFKGDRLVVYQKKFWKLYMNQIWLNRSCYGIQTASKVYFGKDVKDLSLLPSARL
ncbi:MAG: transglycosylase domain-containing protein [Dialister invisus]